MNNAAGKNSENDIIAYEKKTMMLYNEVTIVGMIVIIIHATRRGEHAYMIVTCHAFILKVTRFPMSGQWGPCGRAA